MQRKRAIAQLCNLKEHCNEMAKYNKEWESDVVALDIAIKALKKEPCEDCGADMEDER